ncbi:MAG: ArgR family transcriptional regulator [Actinomycetes bacterium]|jgi:transcriptional regulator of arginine metabolism|nr:ArgR family transcriptional regulator [Actinomycetes bacterium]
MKFRKERQEAMRLIVRNSQIRTQHELVTALHEQGYHCTQATVSRDIGEMKLKKLPEGIYVLAEDLHLQRMVHDLSHSVARSGNLIIIHAQGGTAPGVAGAIDEADIDGVLGTVSGDTTLLIVTVDEAHAVSLEEKLRSFAAPAKKKKGRR